MAGVVVVDVCGGGGGGDGHDIISSLGLIGARIRYPRCSFWYWCKTEHLTLRETIDVCLIGKIQSATTNLMVLIKFICQTQETLHSVLVNSLSDEQAVSILLF